MLCLIFTSLNDGQNAAKKIWSNKIKEQAALNPDLIIKGTQTYTVAELEQMSDEQLSVLSLRNTTKKFSGFNTIAWAKVIKIHLQNKWYFKKPDNFLLSGVLNYTEEYFNSSWLVPRDI